MRIVGWVLLVGGFMLCVSVLLAALGFVFMGFGLIFLQIAEQNNKSPATSDASRSGQSEPQRAPPPPRAKAASHAEEEREVVDRESAIGPSSYDKERWRFLLRNDADISRVVTVLAPYGQHYVDELAAAYLALNDKDHLPMILRQIIASVRRDSHQNVTGDRPREKSNEDAVGLAFGRIRRVDRVRNVRSGDIDKRSSAQNVPRIDVGPEFSGHVEVGVARETAAEETTLKPVGAQAESSMSPASQIAAESANPKPPVEAVTAIGLDEKRGAQEVDAVDADNLAEILNRLSPGQVSSSKTE